jgi:hypothetical protein
MKLLNTVHLFDTTLLLRNVECSLATIIMILSKLDNHRQPRQWVQLLETLLRTGPLDKLTFVEKAGINLEKDVKKDLILYGGFEWKEFTPLGITPYVKLNSTGGVDTISSIRTSEFIARIRWTKDEEFIGGVV